MSLEKNISNFCSELEGDKCIAIDNQCLVELELNDTIKRWLKSTIILPNDHIIRKELCKLRTGRLLSWGTKFMRLINDDSVTKGTKLIFKNNDGDIRKHPTKDIFYKIIEAPDVEAKIE